MSLLFFIQSYKAYGVLKICSSLFNRHTLYYFTIFLRSKTYLQLVTRLFVFQKKIIVCELLSNIVSGIDQ